ncbi:MAG: hypothetical protein HY005_00545 [Candidatus Staskawiczbacteria bacterium]|nr:hypothetical protein [Candidatus Staskawiczbacteria bacterium]
MITTLGIERERFIINSISNKIVPAIGILLPKVHEEAKRISLSEELFTYELFAGQIEDKTLPCNSLLSLKDALITNDQIMRKVASKHGLGFDFSELVEENRISSLEVNPFSKRHQNLWYSISPERRLAASVVAAVHVHLAIPESHVVKILNICRRKVIGKLTKIGDHSDGKRINAYTIMAKTDGVPPLFSNFKEVLEYINVKGGEKNVWDLVRFKPSTRTIEFRMFGTTESIEEIIEYAKACLEIVKFS